VSVASETTVTLPIEVVRNLFAASNHSFGEPTPLQIACDIIEHAAMELDTLGVALHGNSGNSRDLALHASRASEQIKAGLEIVKVLDKTERAQ
jgi:hypothetical protein